MRVRGWLERVGVTTLFIEPGSPWENGYCESFNGRLRDELLAREQFDTLLEAKVLIERWRRHYNTIRPHGSLGYRPPAPRGDPAAWLASGYAYSEPSGRPAGVNIDTGTVRGGWSHPAAPIGATGRGFSSSERTPCPLWVSQGQEMTSAAIRSGATKPAKSAPAPRFSAP